MFAKTSLTDWENIVKKQLKSEDLYVALQQDNLEGVLVKPYYGKSKDGLSPLPKVAESTHLVAEYSASLDENVSAILLNQNVEMLEDKVIFINNKDLAEHISPLESNQYFSLIDVFSDDTDGVLKENLAKELLEKSFGRNICIDVALHQNAGASIIQQLALALSKTKDLLEVFGAEILDRLVYRLAVGGHYFFEIAKIRALKLLVNELFKEYGREGIPFIFAENTLRNKSAHDPENNLIRSTLEMSAAMVAGADAVFSHDFKMEEGDGLSAEIAFKQQIVLAYESIINVFEDAAGGSYLVEDLTRQFAEKSWQSFLEMEEAGGYAELFKSGKIQKEIYNHAVLEQQWVEDGKISLIGVNLYPKLEKTKSVEELYDPFALKAVRWSAMYE